MNFQPKHVRIIIGVCSLASLSTALTRAQCAAQCFDCSLCDYEYNQECESTFSAVLCRFLIQQCKIDHGCNKPTTDIIIYPANDFNASDLPELQPLTLNMRKNCCYELTGFYDETLSNIKTLGACVNLYSDHGCTGNVLRVDRNFPCARSNTNVITLDCPQRINAGGVRWNDVPSSMRLC